MFPFHCAPMWKLLDTPPCCHSTTTTTVKLKWHQISLSLVLPDNDLAPSNSKSWYGECSLLYSLWAYKRFRVYMWPLNVIALTHKDGYHLLKRASKSRSLLHIYMGSATHLPNFINCSYHSMFWASVLPHFLSPWYVVEKIHTKALQTFFHTFHLCCVTSAGVKFQEYFCLSQFWL